MNEIYSNKLKIKFQKHSVFILDVFIVLLWVTAFLMFIIMCVGIFQIAKGILTEIGYSIQEPGNEKNGFIRILHGLELIFVSPLFYLLTLSLTKYITAIKPEVNPDLNVKKEFMNHAITELMTVKTLSISLFISILLLHSIGLIINDNMSFHTVIYVLFLLIVLIGYYYILDILIHRLRNPK